MEEQGDIDYSRLFHVNYCGVYLAVCDFASAARSSRLALESAEKAHDPLFHYLAADMAAWTHNRTGELELALGFRQRSVEIRARHGSNYMKERFESCHAEILLKTGSQEAARELAAQAATAARERGLMWALPWAERVWGCALAELGADAASVNAHLSESLAAALRVGNVMEALRTEIAWGEVHLTRQDPTAASACFRAARARINEEMLPCTQEHFLPLVAQGLQRCGTPA